MKVLSSLALSLALLSVVGCGPKKNNQVDLVKEYDTKYGEAKNASRQSQGVQPLPQGWACSATDTQISWVSPNTDKPGFVSKTVQLSKANGDIVQEEDRFILSIEPPRKALTIISKFDADKVTGQTARKENATPEGMPIPLEEAKTLVKAVLK